MPFITMMKTKESAKSPERAETQRIKNMAFPSMVVSMVSEGGRRDEFG